MVIAGLIAGFASTYVVAKEDTGQQVQKIVNGMSTDGITVAEIQAAAKANPKLAAEIIEASLNAVPAEKREALAASLFYAVPEEMQDTVLAGAVFSGLDPSTMLTATAAGNPDADSGNTEK